MDLLLDTHIFLWSLLEPERLPDGIVVELENSGNSLWLSPISIWETLLLAEKNRIRLKSDPSVWIRDVFNQIPFQEAPLNSEVALESRSINLEHADPADRFIAATARVYKLILVTMDRRLRNSPDIPVLTF